MRPIVARVGPLAPAAVGALALAQPGVARVGLILSGALAAPVTAFVLGLGMVTSVVAMLDTPRRVGVTSGGNDSGIIFAISGLDRAGNPISEALQGANAGQAVSALDYAAVTAVVPSGATAANVSVDTVLKASSAWVRLDDDVASPCSIQCVPSGTVTALIEQTLDDPNSPATPVVPSAMTWLPHPSPEAQNITGQGGPVQTTYAEVPIFSRVTLTAGTGSVVATFAQLGRQSPS